MKSQSLRTVYIVYHVLIVLLSIILSCNSKAFDWGNIRPRYGDRDNEVFEQDVRMPGVIPKSDDQYMCTSVQMPRQDAYIVNFEPHATMKKAHHMLLYGCFDIVSSPGEAYSCMGMGVCKGGQSSILFAWARDAPAPSIPEGVGFHVGGDSRINYVTLQIHYGHKDAFADGEDDSSGIKLSMTYQQQPYLAGIYLMVSGEIRVPPHTHSVHTDMACEYNNEVPIYPFAFRTHAHELGKVISGYLIKGDSRGTWFEIAKGDPTWPQAFYPMQPGIEIKRGDWLAARCTYSSERDDFTGVGPTGEDEMCNLYLMYYTDAEFGHSFDMCGQPARGDIESHFPSNSDIPPDEMPAMIEQPPAGQQHGYYGYDDNEYYNPYQLNDYRQRLQDMFGGDRDYPSENFLDLNRNGWIDDDEVLDNKDKAETEKPSKVDDTTPSILSQKGNKEDEDETTHEEQPKQDTATGKLTLADWHTDDSVTLGQVAGVAVDAKGNVHVFHRAERAWNIESFDANNRYAQADDGPIANNTILAFNKDTGKIEHQWGGKVESVTECATCFNGFYMPHGLSIDHEGNIWLTDVALHQVFKFPPGGAQTPLLTLGEKLTPGPDKDHFCKPADVAVDPTTGNFFVADGYCNSRIMKFSPQGDFLMQWGKVTYKSSGYPSDAFLIPHSLTFLKDKDVLCVADREHGRIQCFNSGDGSYVDSFKQDTFGDRVFAVHYNPWNGGILYAVNGPSGERVPVQGFTLHYGDRQVLQTWKPGNEEFQNPHDVECSADNTAVYVAEIGPNKVWKFDVDIVVTPDPEETNKQEETVNTPAKSSSIKTNNVVKSFQAQEADLQAQTDEDIKGHKIKATDANTATTAIIIAVLAVPIVLMMMVAVAVRLRAQGKIKFGGNGLSKGYSSTADRFSLGNFFNKRRGFNQVSTEDSDHDGGMEWSEESDIEEYSILNNQKTSQNL